MNKNTAKITEPIWDSRNSDEPKSETPRTDTFSKGYYEDLCWIDFARALERELNAEKKWKAEDPQMLREQIRVAGKRLRSEKHQGRCNAEAADNWRRACASAEQERDALRKAQIENNHNWQAVEEVNAMAAECDTLRAQLQVAKAVIETIPRYNLSPDASIVWIGSDAWFTWANKRNKALSQLSAEEKK